MSSKASKKNAAAKTNEIVTRTKSAQQSRQLRAKNKKTEKPIVTKPSPKAEKSTKVEKSGRKDTPLQNKVRQLVQLVEQAEYHPEKLKRDLSTKKIFLKPKPNLKVIATANKRKMGVPRKGGVSQTPSKKRRSSPKSSKRDSFCDMSMPDIVRLIEDTQSLSDEDFMEILTCPSPVWWEDPSDEEYIEDAICKRPPSQASPTTTTTDENNQSNEQKDKRTNTSTDKTDTKPTENNKLIDFENEIAKFKITTKADTGNNKFKAKKQKLESILGNIKNVKCNKKKDKIKDDEIKKDVQDVEKPRKLSTSDGEDLSDLSFNDEEILKNLENIQIPIEQTVEQNENNKIEIDIIGTETKEKISPKKIVIPIPEQKDLSMPKITVKKFARNQTTNKLIVPDKMPPLTRKPDIHIKKTENPNLSDYLDNVSHSNFKFISDDEVTFLDDKDKNNFGESSSLKITTDEKKEKSDIKIEKIDTADATGNNKKVFFRKRVIKDLSEYITVYKIMSQEKAKNALDIEKLNKNAENTNSNVRGKLNNFFKKRKSNKRVTKSDSSFPVNTLTAVKELPIEYVNSDDNTSVVNDENRLKPCECDEKTASEFACDSCNFHADTKELYKNHVSSCKEIARIPWNHNYITNKT